MPECSGLGVEVAQTFFCGQPYGAVGAYVTASDVAVFVLAFEYE